MSRSPASPASPASPGSPPQPEVSNTVCLTCRSRKVRCDRQRPRCGLCRRNNLDCDYVTSQKTSGLRAGYVTRLERRIESLEEEFSSFRANVNSHIKNTAREATDLQLTALTRETSSPQSANGETFDQQAISQPEGTDYSSQENLSKYLSQECITNYCHIWFDQYHSWFPILHQPTVFGFCDEYVAQMSHPASLILKAIAVVVIPTQVTNTTTSWDRDHRLLSLGDDIILAAIHHLSLRTLQALLILTIAEYGNGRIAEFWNLISLCKRMSMQLGLRDLVAYNCMNFGFPSVVPPRMLEIPLTAVEREEKIRAFWATDALDSASTLGVAWHLSISRPEPAASLPCDEEIWRFPESVIAMYQFGSSDAPSSYSLYVRLVTNELWHVHDFLQQTFDPTSVEESMRRQEECDAVFQKLAAWKTDFEQLLSVHTPVYVDLFSACDTPTHHPNTILIQCTIHSAIISLYQRHISTINGLTNFHPWEHAAERCVSSSNQLAEIIQSITEQTLEASNPHIVYCIFVAARFLIIYSNAMGMSLPIKLQTLIYALRVCGRRWPLARQLHTVLEAALPADSTTSAARTPLPIEFFDLQYFSLDVHEALRRWIKAREGE